MILFIQISQVMSYFRNFNKVISASKLGKPNNLLFQPCNSPIYICTSTEPSIDHLNTLKALHSTIKKIDQYSSITTASSFSNIIQKELKFLNSAAQNYQVLTINFVERGGKLTAQGLANLYACADQLQVSSQWLEKYVYEDIPHHIDNMSVSNLNDTIKGVQNFHQNSKYLPLLEKELAKRNQEPYEYVKRLPNDANIYEQAEYTKSNNILINSLEKGGSLVTYYQPIFINSIFNFLKSVMKQKVPGYVLHEE